MFLNGLIQIDDAKNNDVDGAEFYFGARILPRNKNHR